MLLRCERAMKCCLPGHGSEMPAARRYVLVGLEVATRPSMTPSDVARCGFCRNDKPLDRQYGRRDPGAARICDACVDRLSEEAQAVDGAQCSFCLRAARPGRQVCAGPESSTTYICQDCLVAAKRWLQAVESRGTGKLL